jgi:hypothetical protein
MTTQCPLCHAEYPSGETCQERFETCLALEFENPGTYGAVHHLTVACFMLQHNRYSREGWLQARALLAGFVDHGANPDRVRREHRQAMDGRQRTWSFTRCDKLAEFDRIVWTRTIADLHTGEPVRYCEDVQAWAESVLSDTEFLFLKA